MLGGFSLVGEHGDTDRERRARPG